MFFCTCLKLHLDMCNYHALRGKSIKSNNENVIIQENEISQGHTDDYPMINFLLKCKYDSNDCSAPHTIVQSLTHHPQQFSE